jgi:hypothetical protein
MIKNLKILGLTVVAVLAFGVVAASAASAAVEFHGSEAGLNLTGEQTVKNVFTTDAGTVECEKAVFTGTTTALAAPTQQVHPEYKECTVEFLGFHLEAPVNTTGCDYVLHAAGGAVDIVCGSGSEIVVSAPGCTVDVPGGQTVNSVSYANEGTAPNRSVVVTSNVNNIQYTEHGSFPNTCAHSGEATTGGTYTGAVTVEAPGDIWVE